MTGLNFRWSFVSKFFFFCCIIRESYIALLFSSFGLIAMAVTFGSRFFKVVFFCVCVCVCVCVGGGGSNF